MECLLCLPVLVAVRVWLLLVLLLLLLRPFYRCWQTVPTQPLEPSQPAPQNPPSVWLHPLLWVPH